MREFFISLDTRDGIMDEEHFEDAIIKVVRNMNMYKEDGRLQVYIMSLDNILKRSSLLEKIIAFLDKTSINDMDIHIISNDDYLSVKDETIDFAKEMIVKYIGNDHTDVIMDIKVDSDIIYSSDRIEVLKLFVETGQKYLRIWLNVTEDSIDHFPAVITRIAEVKMLHNTSITFELDLYKTLTEKTKQALKDLPFYVLNYLMDTYIEEMNHWAEAETTCFNQVGDVIWRCPSYRECVLVTRKRSEARMARLLVELVRDLASGEKVGD